MKNSPNLTPVRNPERGAVAMMVAFMWTALFGMAVLAVDFGYLYTKRRNVQAVADSAVRAGMPVYTPGNISAASLRAISVANANGYGVNGNGTVVPSEPAANQFRVTIRATYPTFFGSLFGVGAKQVTGLATGRVPAGSAGSSIHANDPGCSPQFGNGGVNIGGQGRLVVNGDITTTNNKIEVASWDASCTPATCKVTGVAKSPCAVYNDSPANLGVPSTSTASTVDPLALNVPAIVASCTVGNLATDLATLGGLPWNFNAAGNCDQLLPANQVFCSSQPIAVNGMGAPNICANASFISAVGVTIGVQGNINLTASTAAPLAGGANVLVYVAGPGTGCGVPSVNIANGPAPSVFTMTGTIYAPTGCINISSNTLSYTSNGMVDGFIVNISMGPGMPWTFNGPGGGGGGGGPWTMFE